MSSQKVIENDTETSIDFGEKKVRKHGEYTRVIALDKTILENCGCDPDKEIKARVELIKRPEGDFIKVTPTCIDDSTDNNKNGEINDQ